MVEKLIDWSKFKDDFSGSPEMKLLTKFIDEKLSDLFSFPIQLIPEGLPYMFSMVQWEVLRTEKKKSIWFYDDSDEPEKKQYLKLKLLMYPAGFFIRPHDVLPYKEEIVLSIQKTIVNVLEKE